MGMIYSQLLWRPPYPTQSFANRTIIVTGANVGLGFEAARHFVRLNAARAILAVRNLEAGEIAKNDIEASTQRSGVVEVWKLDLCSHQSVKSFAAKANAELPRLDVLMLNASVATLQFNLDEEVERHVTVNVVSTFMLLFMLLPLMRKTSAELKEDEEKPRLCLVGSNIHHWVDMPPEEYPEGEVLATLSKPENFKTKCRGMNMCPHYPYSKLLQALLVRAIAPLIDSNEIIFNHVNPGLVATQLTREGDWMFQVMGYLMARTAEVGSRTLVAGAVAGKESHRKMMDDAQVQEDGSPRSYSTFVLSKEGKVMEDRVWKEVDALLESKGVDVRAALRDK